MQARGTDVDKHLAFCGDGLGKGCVAGRDLESMDHCCVHCNISLTLLSSLTLLRRFCQLHGPGSTNYDGRRPATTGGGGPRRPHASPTRVQVEGAGTGYLLAL